MHDALQNDDGGFFLARMRTQHVVCTPEDLVPRGPGGPPCTEAGQELDVIPIGGWLSEGADVSSIYTASGLLGHGGDETIGLISGPEKT